MCLLHQGQHTLGWLLPQPLDSIMPLRNLRYAGCQRSTPYYLERHTPAEALPGRKQCLHSLFRRQAPHKESISTASLPSPRIRVDEVRLHDDLLRRQAAPDKLLAGELSECGVDIHEIRPGAANTVGDKERCDYRARCAIRLIAGMYDSRPGHEAPQAIFAHPFVPIEVSIEIGRAHV